MRVLEATPTVDLPDQRVAICGDWHSNLGWLRVISSAIRTLAPDITTVLQAGDWGMDPASSDQILATSGIDRVLVTLGNHEFWPGIVPVLEACPGEAARVSSKTWILPRPFRLRIANREVLSLGGASSVDRLWRTPGRNWWPDEAITDAEVDTAVAGGPAHIMITHESPARTPVGAVRAVLAENPHRFPEETLLESAASRARISRAWDATSPSLLFHGHMHAAGAGTATDGRRVVSLGRDVQEGNLAFLDLRDLSVETPSLREIREAVGRG